MYLVNENPDYVLNKIELKDAWIFSLTLYTTKLVNFKIIIYNILS